MLEGEGNFAIDTDTDPSVPALVIVVLVFVNGERVAACTKDEDTKRWRRRRWEFIIRMRVSFSI